jgi:hypothetical protein
VELRSVLSIQQQLQPDGFLTTFLEETLEEWERVPSLEGRTMLLRELIRTSELKLANQEPREDIVRALEAALQLYGEDPAMATPVAEIRSLLLRLK